MKMVQNNNPIPTPEYLRTEYQVCQQSADAQSSSHWSFAGIFLGLSTAGLAFIVPNIFLINNIGFKIFVTFISIGMLAIIFAVHSKLIRTNVRNDRFYDRMREIERGTGMKAELMQKELIGRFNGMFYWRIIIVTLSIFWFLTILFIWGCQSA